MYAFDLKSDKKV